MARREGTFFYSLVSLTLMLFLAGLLGLIAVTAYRLGIFFREQIIVSVILDEEIDSVHRQQIYTWFQHQPYVKKARLITKEQALAKLKRSMPDIDPQLIGFNPLFDVIELRLRAAYTHPDSLARLTRQWQQRWPAITEVVYHEDLVRNLETYVKRATLVLAALTVLLLLATVFIINSTLRLSVYTRRFLIKNMETIGASWWLILRPFLARAFWLAVLSFIFSAGLLYGVYHYSTRMFPELKSLINLEWLAFIGGALLMLALLVSLLTTFFSVLRYLRMRIEDLY